MATVKNKTTAPAAKSGKTEAVKTATQKPAPVKIGNKTGKAKAAKPSAKDAKSADKSEKRCAALWAEAAENRILAFNLLVEGTKHVCNALGQLGYAAIDLRKSFSLMGVADEDATKEIVEDVCKLTQGIASTYEPLVRTIHRIEANIGLEETDFDITIDNVKVVNIPMHGEQKPGRATETVVKKADAKKSVKSVSANKPVSAKSKAKR